MSLFINVPVKHLIMTSNKPHDTWLNLDNVLAFMDHHQANKCFAHVTSPINSEFVQDGIMTINMNLDELMAKIPEFLLDKDKTYLKIL